METTPTIREVRREHEPTARCKPNQKNRKHLCTFGTPADAFLRHSFLPLFESGEEFSKPKKVESDFIKSLGLLVHIHSCTIADIRCKPFPYNVLLAYSEVQKQLNSSQLHIDLAIEQNRKGKVTLTVTQTYETNSTLYFIPILPLYELLQIKKQKQAAELLLSVFAYLYHIAEIPYYRDPYSALSYYYEMHTEWILDDLENCPEEDINRYFSELNKGSHYGDVMHRKMYNPYQLSVFEKRIENFKPRSYFESECLRIAKEGYQLFCDYPKSSIFRYTSNQKFDDNEETIRARQYISFIAESQSILFRDIEQLINNEFNECSTIEQPSIKQRYKSKSKLSNDSLDFECRIFSLINDLCTLLNTTL